MTIDRNLIGIGAALLALVLAIYMPVSSRKANQTILSAVVIALVFVAAFSLLEPAQALPVAVVVSALVVVARFAAGTLRSFLYHNVFRYTRRDYWNRRVGRAILGGSRRGRRRNED